MILVRSLAGVALVMFAAAACSGSASPTASAAPTLAPASIAAASPSPVATPTATPVPSPSPAPSSTPAPPKTDVTIIAQGTKFTTPDVTGPAGKQFTIGFQNLDEGASHNLHIRSAAGAEVFTGARVTGVVTTVYHVPALKAGTYPFICDVHPVEMTGTLTVP